MSWVAVGIGGALTFFQSASSSNAANQQASQSYTQSLKTVDAQNDAILQANTANVIRTGYRVGLQNLQTARATIQASQQGYDISTQGVAAMGQNQAVAAASGTVGSSVAAAAGDIEKKMGEAQIDNDVTFADTMQNAQIAVQQTIMAGQDAILSPVDVNSTLPNQTNSLSNALLATAGSFASTYASGKLKLGAKAPVTAVSPAYSSSLLGGIQGSYIGGFDTDSTPGVPGAITIS